MISEKMSYLVNNSSVIRAMFEEGKRLASLHGADKVFDFSLGNPNTEAPEAVKQAIIDVLNERPSLAIHGYMSNAGYEEVREAIAQSINKKHGTAFNQTNILMTVGAAGGINVILKAILNPGDEVIAFAPFFGEYRSYVANADGQLVVVSPNTVDFQPNLVEFKEKITVRTKAVFINSPNNPTGVIYSEDTIKEMANILRDKQKELGTDIYIIADEPYRELAYDNIPVPYLTKYYENTVVAYSYSKSLSLPGERIGYLVLPDEAADAKNLKAATNIANRILVVNAPSLFQLVIAKVLDTEVDLSFYNKNRETLFNGLTSFGYECIKPEGAFYLFMKTPMADDNAFCELAKKYNILMVPGSFFSCPGFARIAYCVSHETIVNSLPGFKALMEEVKSNQK